MSQRHASLRSLAAQLQGLTSERMRAELHARLGPPDRDVGSGLQIDQWDLAAGVLTFHPHAGPNVCSVSGETVWLLETHNPVGDNLHGTFDLSTRPAPPFRTTTWLGCVRFAADGTYAADNIESAASSQPVIPDGCCFHRHPSGIHTIAYASGISPHVDLEDVPDGSIVGQILCTSASGERLDPLAIATHRQMRALMLIAGPNQEFSMCRFWSSTGMHR